VVALATSPEIIEAQARLDFLLEQEPRDEAAITELLDALADAIPDKLHRLHLVASRAKSDASMLREQKKQIDSAIKRAERTAARVSSFALEIVARSGGKVATPLGNYSTRTTTRIAGPADAAEWVAQGWFRVEEKPDKSTAKDFLLSGGKAPPGFSIERHESIRWPR